MKSTKLIVLTLWAMVLFMNLQYGWAQHHHTDDEKNRMEKWMKYSTPGHSHHFLAELEGEWETVSKIWMQPGAPPAESTGIAHGKMILGGRYLQQHYKGKMMGMPYDAVLLVAYDNHLKKFISIWIDNMGTGITRSSGDLDSTGKILTEWGEMYDAMSGHNLKMKTVTTKISHEKFSTEMYHVTPDGKEFKSMEIVYTKKR